MEEIENTNTNKYKYKYSAITDPGKKRAVLQKVYFEYFLLLWSLLIFNMDNSLQFVKCLEAPSARSMKYKISYPF